MHHHTLYRDVKVTCECCRIDAMFYFKSASDLVICKSCQRHYGSERRKLELRDEDHRNLWASELRLRAENHAATIEHLHDTIKQQRDELAALRLENDGLRTTVIDGFDRAAPADVQRILIDREVREAGDERDSAYRSRDHAMRVLWQVNEIHHPDTRGGCSCRVPSCRTNDLVDAARNGLYSWEKRQIERARAGRAHGLPREHPDYREYRDFARVAGAS